MLAETALEILRYFSRLELESLQVHARFLRDIVNRNVSILPLRYINEIRTLSGGPQSFPDGRVLVWLDDVRRVNLLNGDSYYEASDLSEVGLELLFHRVNNAFVERFEIFFSQTADARFLGHLQKRASAFESRVKILSTPIGPRTGSDYALVDFAARHLKPRCLHASVFDGRETAHAMLFDHASMRSVLRHVFHYASYWDMADANCVIPALLDIDTLETFGIHTYGDAMAWIVRFANAFETTNRRAKSVRSVTLVRQHGRNDVLNLRGKTPRKDVPAAHSDFVKGFLCLENINEATADPLVFYNVQLRKRLDVSMATGVKTLPDFGGHRTIGYDIFLLQINDI